jgi:hypothetical protein
VLQKGMNIFNGILKSVSDVALDILPFGKTSKIIGKRSKPIQAIKVHKRIFKKKSKFF